LRELVVSRQPDVVGKAGWKNIDAVERADGKAAGRPRVKRTTTAELLKAAQA
jgi:ferredoxin--NADP+ reductase